MPLPFITCSFQLKGISSSELLNHERMRLSFRKKYHLASSRPKNIGNQWRVFIVITNDEKLGRLSSLAEDLNVN